MTDLPVRTCPGCGQTDDHPRMLVIDSANARELPFHYDCVPHYLRETHPSPAYQATASGKRGAEVREVIVKHAAKLAKED